jgi:hypothetical protein
MNRDDDDGDDDVGGDDEKKLRCLCCGCSGSLVGRLVKASILESQSSDVIATALNIGILLDIISISDI